MTLGEQFVQRWGMSPLEASRRYGKGSQQLISMLNAVSEPFGETFHPTGSLVSDIIKTAAPGIVLATGGLAAPLLAQGGEKVETGFTAPFESWIQPVIGLASQVISALQMPPTRIPPMTGPSTVPGPFGLPIPVAQVEQIQAGTSVSASAFRGVCKPSRRRFKIQYDATGTPHVISVCPARRMNPLNPRALSRAARRLGSFQRIAGNIEKMVQKACRSGIGRGRRSSRMPAYCGKKRGC